MADLRKALAQAEAELDLRALEAVEGRVAERLRLRPRASRWQRPVAASMLAAAAGVALCWYALGRPASELAAIEPVRELPRSASTIEPAPPATSAAAPVVASAVATVERPAARSSATALVERKQPLPEIADPPPEKGEPSAGETGKLVAIAIGGSCAFAVDGQPSGSGSSTRLTVTVGAHVVSCTPPGDATRTQRVIVTAEKPGIASFRL